MNDLISRQAAIDTFRKSLCALEIESGREYGISFSGVERILKSLPSAQPEPFTDEEQRIFLSAMERHEHVCKHVDAVYGNSYEDGLLRICHNITRKVKGALWT